MVRVCTAGVIVTVDSDRAHRTAALFTRSHTGKLLFLLCPHCAFALALSVHTYRMGRYAPLPWRWCRYTNYLEVFYMEICVFSHIYLLVYLFTWSFILMWTYGYLFYALAYSLMLPFLIKKLQLTIDNTGWSEQVHLYEDFKNQLYFHTPNRSFPTTNSQLQIKCCFLTL